MRRHAFTLVELLVVLAIICILMALSMVAMSGARNAGKRTEVRSEIQQMTMAASLFKNKFGVNPPLSGGDTTGRFRLCTTYLNASGKLLPWPEVDVLLAMFPSMDMADNGLRITGSKMFPSSPEYLDGNQALMFWLCGSDFLNYQGFATDPRRPFKAPDLSLLNEKRIGPFFQPRQERFVDGQYLDSKGIPYACFGYVQWAKTYQPGVRCCGITAIMNTAQNPPKPFNPDTVQIISAGIDRQFGTEDDLNNFTR